MTYRLGAAFAAVVFAVTSGITAMDVHQLAAHGSQPLIAPTTPPTPVALAPGGHDEQGQNAQDGHEGHHAPAAAASAAHASHPSADGLAGHGQQTSQAGQAGHSGHSEHESNECTCVGPCASGAPPTLSEPTFAEMWLAEPDPVRVVTRPVDPVHQDPRSYLLPFSTAPPAGV